MSRFRFTHQQAQQLRHQPASAGWMYQVDEVVREVFGELTNTLQRTLQAYAAEGICIDRLLVTGGGSEQFGLMRRLVHNEHTAPRGG
jgi:Tfp pilus assembly PilM family ATPase